MSERLAVWTSNGELVELDEVADAPAGIFIHTQTYLCYDCRRVCRKRRTSLTSMPLSPAGLIAASGGLPALYLLLTRGLNMYLSIVLSALGAMLAGFCYAWAAFGWLRHNLQAKGAIEELRCACGGRNLRPISDVGPHTGFRCPSCGEVAMTLHRDYQLIQVEPCDDGGSVPPPP